MYFVEYKKVQYNKQNWKPYISTPMLLHTNKNASVSSIYSFSFHSKRIPVANLEANIMEHPLCWNGYSGHRRKPYSYIYSFSAQEDENCYKLLPTWAYKLTGVPREPFTIYLIFFTVNLSVADTMVSTLNVTFNYVYMLKYHWPFGEIYCKISQFIASLSICASVFSLMAISIDRSVLFFIFIKL